MLSIEEENWEPLSNKHGRKSISHLVIKIIPPKQKKKLGIAVITVEPADKIFFVYNCMQTRLRGQYNGK